MQCKNHFLNISLSYSITDDAVGRVSVLGEVDPGSFLGWVTPKELKEEFVYSALREVLKLVDLDQYDGSDGAFH